MAELSRYFPPGMKHVYPNDTTIEDFDNSVQCVIDSHPDAVVDWQYGNLYNPSKEMES